jgi:hypothetical protein
LSEGCDDTVEWDGEFLSGWVTINGKPTKVRADRDIIHAHAGGFSDAIGREISQYRVEIFRKLTPYFVESNKK